MRISFSLSVGIAAAFAIAGVASAQIVQSPSAKILITSCTPHVHGEGQPHPWIDPCGNWHYAPTRFPYWDAFLAITYQNESSVAATEIDFGLVAGDALVAVAKDVGKFSPGVMIDHEFVVSREIFPLGASPRCAVLRVKYADGSVWQNPIPPNAQ